MCLLYRYNNKLQGTLPEEWRTMQPTLIDLHGNQLQVRPGQRSASVLPCSRAHGPAGAASLQARSRLGPTLFSILVLLAGFTAIQLGK